MCSCDLEVRRDPIPDNPTVPARDVQRRGNPDTEDPFAVELDRYGDAFQHRRRRDRLVRRNFEEIGLPRHDLGATFVKVSNSPPP